MRQLVPACRDLDGRAALEELYNLVPGRHVRTNFIASLDAAVELNGRSQSLSRPADRDVFMAMRAVADVILVGAGTVRAERYGPVKLDAGARERRAARGQAPLPRLAIVSARCALDPSLPVLAPGSMPILITSAAAAELHPELAAVTEIMESDDSSVDMSIAIERLVEQGLGRVLCEGGPTLLRSLLSDGLVDEFCLTSAPIIAGAGRLRLSGEEPLPASTQFELLDLLEGDGLLFARYSHR